MTLDDGAVRFIKPNGVAVDSVAPGYTQPLGDWKQLPAGKLVNRWQGEKMDLDLGIEVLSKRAKNVPAGTPASPSTRAISQKIQRQPDHEVLL